MKYINLGNTDIKVSRLCVGCMSYGKPDIEKMHLISFDPIHNGYVEMGQRVGNAFADGSKLK